MTPLAFRPLIKQIRWGGRRLGDVLGKSIGEENDYAESWEIVDHGADQSVVVAPESSPHVGATLNQLVRSHGEAIFGTGSQQDQFPLLIKFLDASDRLSVQVHPDDALAKCFDPDENGKTEAWIVLDAQPSAKLYAGLLDGVKEADLRSALADGTVESLLHTIDVRAGDCVFVPAGTVHAIGEGVLLAEVQQASDMTFRLYDWGRVGTDGNPRQLHIEESIRATDWNRGPVVPVSAIPLDDGGERLVECPFFTIDRYDCSNHKTLPASASARILIGLDGNALLGFVGGQLPISKGQTVLVPCGCKATIDGAVQYLDVTFP